MLKKKSLLESNPTNLPTQNNMTETSKTLRENWFEGYRIEDDIDVFASLPIDECVDEW